MPRLVTSHEYCMSNVRGNRLKRRLGAALNIRATAVEVPAIRGWKQMFGRSDAASLIIACICYLGW